MPDSNEKDPKPLHPEYIYHEHFSLKLASVFFSDIIKTDLCGLVTAEREESALTTQPEEAVRMSGVNSMEMGMVWALSLYLVQTFAS